MLSEKDKAVAGLGTNLHCEFIWHKRLIESICLYCENVALVFEIHASSTKSSMHTVYFIDAMKSVLNPSNVYADSRLNSLEKNLDKKK